MDSALSNVAVIACACCTLCCICLRIKKKITPTGFCRKKLRLLYPLLQMPAKILRAPVFRHRQEPAYSGAHEHTHTHTHTYTQVHTHTCTHTYTHTHTLFLSVYNHTFKLIFHFFVYPIHQLRTRKIVKTQERHKRHTRDTQAIRSHVALCTDCRRETQPQTPMLQFKLIIRP